MGLPESVLVNINLCYEAKSLKVMLLFCGVSVVHTVVIETSTDTKLLYPKNQEKHREKISFF